MPHSNDGVIHLTNPMPSQSFVSEVKIFVMWKNWLLNPIYFILIVPCFLLQSMSQTQAHGNEDQALNLTWLDICKFFFFFCNVGISSVHATFKWWSYRLNKSNTFPELCVRGKDICNVKKMVIESYLLYTYCTTFSFAVNVTESSSWIRRPSLKPYLIRYM